jgi:hypothetical protein
MRLGTGDTILGVASGVGTGVETGREQKMYLELLSLGSGLNNVYTHCTASSLSFGDSLASFSAMLFPGRSNSILLTREYYQEYSCPFDLLYYPFDTQVQSVQLACNVSYLPLHFSSLDVQDGFRNSGQN